MFCHMRTQELGATGDDIASTPLTTPTARNVISPLPADRD